MQSLAKQSCKQTQIFNLHLVASVLGLLIRDFCGGGEFPMDSYCTTFAVLTSFNCTWQWNKTIKDTPP